MPKREDSRRREHTAAGQGGRRAHAAREAPVRWRRPTARTGTSPDAARNFYPNYYQRRKTWKAGGHRTELFPGECASGTRFTGTGVGAGRTKWVRDECFKVSPPRPSAQPQNSQMFTHR